MQLLLRLRPNCNLLTKDLFIIKSLRVKLSFSQIVRISEDCDQNGDRVSKDHKSFHICIMIFKGVSAKYEKYGSVVTIVIVPLLLPTLFGKRGIFTLSPLVAILCSNIAVDLCNHSLIQNKTHICR